MFDFLEMRSQVPAVAVRWFSSSQVSNAAWSPKSRPSDGAGDGDGEGLETLGAVDRGLRGIGDVHRYRE